MTPFARLQTLASHPTLTLNPTRASLIADALAHREALATATGALAVWYPAFATGRIPKDTFVVRHGSAASAIDWNAPDSHAMEAEEFDRLFDHALLTLRQKERLYALDRVIGADPGSALSVRILTDRAITALFADTMFRPPSPQEGAHLREGFTLLVLPTERDRRVIAMDIDRRIAIVYGTSYLGAVKKTMFTVMNTLLPEQGILPLHCAAAENEHGRTHLFLGLSGTGKTTLSTAPGLKLIGDDEHLWTAEGVFNMESGCYAKLIRIDSLKEPAIHRAVFTPRPTARNGVIVENAMTYPDGFIDPDDERLTENSRAAYPLSFLSQVKPGSCGTHPDSILFLTADARGVLPPIAKLTLPQAMLWYLMGYTCKLAGTETGVAAPQTTFSRFFGAPFMLREPADYLRLFRAYVLRHQPDLFLVNTGWTGGPVGVGKRMDIDVTRTLVTAALSGNLEDVEYEEDRRFHLFVPKTCPGVGSGILEPRGTWAHSADYENAADALAKEFSTAFGKNFEGRVAEEVARECPGR